MTEPPRRRRNAVLASLEAARRRHPQIGLKNLVAFLYVAENPGIQMVELAEVTGLLLPTASRVVRALCDEATPGSLPPHMGLLRLEKPPEGEPGARRIVLTGTGTALAEEIDRLIARGQTLHGEVKNNVIELQYRNLNVV